jgi:membrane protease YdiL (CAAX protease family)
MTLPSLKTVFKGPQGLRAGWSLVLFGALLVGLVIVANKGASLLMNMQGPPHGELPPLFVLIGEVLAIVPLLIATAIMARIEGRSLWSYGLSEKRPLAQFGLGVAGGVVALSLLVGVMTVTGSLQFDGLALPALPAIGYGLVWFLAFTLAGFAEETMIRGYLQSTLTRGIGFWPGAVLSSVLFAALHTRNPGETIQGIGAVFVAGMVFCLLLRASGSLWLGIGFHGAWDWAESYLYGTPDSGMVAQGHLLISHAAGDVNLSGGTVGPEGSVLATPTLVLIVLLVVWIGRRSGLFAATPRVSSTSAASPEAA